MTLAWPWLVNRRFCRVCVVSVGGCWLSGAAGSVQQQFLEQDSTRLRFCSFKVSVASRCLGLFQWSVCAVEGFCATCGAFGKPSATTHPSLSYCLWSNLLQPLHWSCSSTWLINLKSRGHFIDSCSKWARTWQSLGIGRHY